MSLPANLRKQRGAGMWGTIFVLAVLGFAALVTVKVLPIYLNQLKVADAVKDIAKNGGLHGQNDPNSIRRGLQRHWDIDDISYLQPSDIKVVRDNSGLKLKYDYSPKVNLFYNIYIVIEFKNTVPVTGGKESY